MTGIVLKLVIIAAVFAMIGFGVRRIWRDWTGALKREDQTRHQRDVKERARPDVITLERQDDGTFRPPGR